MLPKQNQIGNSNNTDSKVVCYIYVYIYIYRYNKRNIYLLEINDYCLIKKCTYKQSRVQYRLFRSIEFNGFCRGEKKS